ncbi:hypothetical protein L486_02955 [Kwoniella mangroviensis CBS 10435]|uniref:ZZ-type domain-containing protein n=1 Tax=Kwoniella mangroviensis CBS 10435 TaxID=1331196 RepID=A0A1B9IXM0_9TREE|nr:hypothetical protein L486_02955 [Kwoniella mangroviensis CBS 10435]
MHPSSSRSLADRPNRPLVIKCAFDGITRKVTFPSAATCRLDSLRLRVEECFSLSASPFSLAYTDDDGEEFHIRSSRDLTEAITYFISGDDDAAPSTYSGSTSGNLMYAFPNQKITIRLDVLVEYDGPSLSDTSSVSSFRTGTGSYDETKSQSEGSWRSGGYEESSRSSRRYSQSDYVQESEVASEESTIQHFNSLELDSQPSGSRIQTLSQESTNSQTTTPFGDHDEDPPSLLTASDLGTRWLREQSRLASRKLVSAPRPVARSNRYDDSDEDSEESDDERPGDFALVRDARGRYYYSYHTDASSHSSHSEFGEGPSNRPFSSITLSTSPPQTPLPHELVRIAEPAGPPILAPDCSACGIRLDYMRYVCQCCGEGEFWKENTSKGAKSLLWSSDSDSSSDTTSRTSTESRTVYNVATPSQLTASQIQSSPTTATYRYGLTPPDSPSSPNGDLLNGRRPKARGYELCADCIEVHGIAHTRAIAAKAKSSHAERRRRRQGGDVRHTFREKTWAAEGWVDVEYSEVNECTICRNPLFANRYKCVSCPSFDLCSACYHKVEEIHPAHAFLSLPDVLSSTNTSLGLEEVPPPGHEIPQPARHPGAFCHNCLQDIVGPRFHCAVCAVDLCIQCEAVVLDVNGTSHTADHIMMKIPVPISPYQVDDVSRRARDRWFHQDRTMATGTMSGDGETSSRSSSPTNDTVYAPTAARNPAISPPRLAVTTRDALDHGLKCGNCHEWIMGRRFQCANCPSDPEGYNLCSICELRSYRVHDPTHVFFRFDRPVHIPIRSSRPILPPLYRQPVGKVPTSALSTINPRDPTAYLKHVLHRETLCDVHGDQIRGVWLRCCHCAAGYDVCQEAERASDHDPTHVFVLFKSRVDMNAFRAFADLGASLPKPLLKQQVYIS